MIKKTTQMKTKYVEFLLESYLRTSTKLNNILQNVDDPIASKFIDLIDMDVKTAFNGLDIKSGTNNKITFLSDSQFNNKLSLVSSYHDLIKDTNNSSGIGRIVNSILKDNNIRFTDSEVERFVTKFKSVVDSERVKDDRVRVIKGDDIIKWYNEDTYASPKGGTLWNSCMRHDSCSGYFDIYVKNENVSLVILLDDNEELVARAILWDNVEENGEDGKRYLDRIYYLKEENKVFLNEWVKNNLKIDLNYQDGISDMSVKLSNVSFSQYPYVDTFRYCSEEESKLYSYDNVEYNMIFDRTDGEYRGMSGARIWSEYCQAYLSDDDAVWSDKHNSFLDRNDSCYSEWSSDWLTEDEAIYNEYLEDYIWDGLDRVSVITKYEWTIRGGFLQKDEDEEMFPVEYKSMTEIDSQWYVNDCLVVIDGESRLKTETILYVSDFSDEDLSTNKDMVNLIKCLGITKIPIDILRCFTTNIYHKYMYKLKYYTIEDYLKELKPTDIDEAFRISMKSHYTDLFLKILVFYKPDLLNGELLESSKKEWTQRASQYLKDNAFDYFSDKNSSAIKKPIFNILLHPWDFQKYYKEIDHLLTNRYQKARVKMILVDLLRELTNQGCSATTCSIMKCFISI